MACPSASLLPPRIPGDPSTPIPKKVLPCICAALFYSSTHVHLLVLVCAGTVVCAFRRTKSYRVPSSLVEAKKPNKSKAKAAMAAATQDATSSLGLPIQPFDQFCAEAFRTKYHPFTDIVIPRLLLSVLAYSNRICCLCKLADTARCISYSALP
jgi:hypothetical protein